MAYIGTPVQQALTKVTSQSFNGTGSQTVFTLNRAVNTGEELEVFVNNVQQEPGVGKSYTATGTTLTFDAAPSSGTGNIYVIYRGLAEVTRRLEHDPGTPLAATTGTFSGAFTSPGIDDNATSTAMTLDASGNLLVGKTSPSGSTAGAEMRAAGTVIATVNGDYPLYLNRLTSDGDIAQFRKDGTLVGSIGAKGGDLTLGTGDIGLRFEDSSNSIVPFDTSIAGSTDNDVDLGKSSVRFKDLYLGGGVYLGGTGSANHLNDYEEGNWTPQFGGSSTTGTGTYTTTVGRYVKVGKKVNCWGIIVSSGTHNGTGNLQITGLPFTKENTYLSWGTETSIAYHFGFLSYGTATNVIRLLGPVSNGTFIRFHSFQNSGDTSLPPTPANVQNSTSVYFATTYEVQ